MSTPPASMSAISISAPTAKAALVFAKFKATTVQSEFKLGISTTLRKLSTEERIVML